MTDAFGKTIRLLRETHGYGLREAARKLEISPSYLSRLESCDEPNPPSERVIGRIAQEYGASKKDLMELAGRIPRMVIWYLEDHWQEVKKLQRKMEKWLKDTAGLTLIP